MKKILFITVALFVAAGAMAQKQMQIPVWQKSECNDSDYQKAQLHCFLPANSNGKAVVVCPGGSYMMLCMDYEGTELAPLLNADSVALFVLQYRLPNGRKDVPLSDALQSMRIIRQHAKEWNINKVGIMGFSAGGHLASTLATHFTDSITRPDFQILIYPVVSMQDGVTHSYSRENLLGKNPSQALKDVYSNQMMVRPNTPPAFIALSAADRVVKPKNSLDYAQALIDNKVPVDLHVYEGGFHGWGVHKNFKQYSQWTHEFLFWLKSR